MTAQDYIGYLERAAAASGAEEVERLRAEALERWRGDPWVADLAETLALHRERRALREKRLRLTAARIKGRVDSLARPPAA